MQGFVDVSNMSDLEVKRLGQADDNYDGRNPYAFRRPVARTIQVRFTHNSDDVWAAAWQAYVTNGNQYVKAIMPGVPGHQTNRMIVDGLLADTTKITQESRDKAVLMRQYFKGLTFKLIEGKTLSEFLANAYNIACKDTINSNFDLGVVTSLPATYARASGRDDADRRINFARGGFVGDPTDTVELEIEVIKQNWSQKFMTWYITGITDDDKVVFFAYKNDMTIGSRVKIKGGVKSHRENSTQLTRVKVL